MLLLLILALLDQSHAVSFKPVGATCTVNSECGSSNCRNVGMMGYTCQPVHVGAVCRFASDCTSRTCDIITGQSIGVCALGLVGIACTANTDCSSSFCNGGVCTANVNDPNNVNDPCHVNSDCTSRNCVVNRCEAANVALPAWSHPFSQCSFGVDCTSDSCAPVVTPGFPTRSICKQSEAFGLCAVHSDCVSHHCDLSLAGPAALGFCSQAAVGRPCVANGDCATLNCVAFKCRPVRAGAGCTVNAHCASGMCVAVDMMQNKRCANDIGGFCIFENSVDANPQCVTGACSATSPLGEGFCLHGSAVPASVHVCFHNKECITGLCSAHAFNAEDQYESLGRCLPGPVGARCALGGDCNSNLCDPQTFLCAPAAVGGPCQADSDCRTAFCDCTPLDMMQVMIPRCVGLAGQAGECLPVPPLGTCYQVADCALAGSVCDPSLHQCLLLGNVGVCSSAADCASGVCSAGLCAPCASGADCGSGVCVSGVCKRNAPGGVCVGDYDCTTLNCATGQCRVSHAGGYCDSETDCSTRQCTTNHRCRANSVGEFCVWNDDCVTGRCSACNALGDCLGTEGACQATSAGGSCFNHADCTSAVCTDGRCAVSGFGQLCGANVDCPVGQFCSPPVARGDCPNDPDLEPIAFPHCDVNACATNNGFCDAHATCTPQKCHRRTCSCNEGWFGAGNLVNPDLAHLATGQANTPIDQQPGCRTPCTSTTCDANAVCVAVSFTVTACKCKEGYLGPGYPSMCYVNPCLLTIELGYPCDAVDVCVVPDPNRVVPSPGLSDLTPWAETACLCPPGLYALIGDDNTHTCIPKPLDACATVAGQDMFGGAVACQCGTGNVQGTGTTSFCAPNVAGGECMQDSDCTTLKCLLTDLTARPVRRTCQKSPVGSPCRTNTDCTSFRCDTQRTLTCLASAYNGGCTGNSDCEEGLWCYEPFAEDVPSGASTAPRCVVNKCARANGGCALNNGWCTPLADAVHICSCPPNFFGTGYRFDPNFEGTGCVNPCETDNGGCYVNTEAGSTERSFCRPTSYKSVQCTCPEGKVGDGVGEWGCLRDVCGGQSLPYTQPGTSGPQSKFFYGCPIHSHCITVTVKNSPDGYLSCACEEEGAVFAEPNAGSQYGSCVANPCLVHNGGCPANAACSTDLWARAVCACRAGYLPQGTSFAPGTATCTNNACGTVGPDGKPNNGGCDPGATCLTRDEFIALGNRAPALTVVRVCVCNLPLVGDGFHCLEDPCRSDAHFCDGYANTVCTGLYVAPAGTGGPEVGVGPQVQMTCPCLPGYSPISLLGPSRWSACTPLCSTNNGNCHASTACEAVGSAIQCRCRPGYSVTTNPMEGPRFGAVVSPGQACDASVCAGVPGLPEFVTIGTCASATVGSACVLGCEPSFAPVSAGAVRANCVAGAGGVGAQLVIPARGAICVPANLLPITRVVRSPQGRGWTCSSSGGVTTCVPRAPTLHRSWSESGHTGALTVSWRGLGTSVDVVRLDVILSGAAADMVGVEQNKPNPQPRPTRSGTTTFTGLHPGKPYSVKMVATVRTSAEGVVPEETMQYPTQDFPVVACSATC